MYSIYLLLNRPVLRPSLLVATLFYILGLAASVGAQDTVYTHWPTVQHAAYDPVQRDLLFRQITELLARPVLRSKRPAQGGTEVDSTGRAALDEAYRNLELREFVGASRAAEQALRKARQSGNRRLEMQALNAIGAISREVFLGSSLKAVPYHEQALVVAQELRDSAYMITQYLSLADNYGQAGQYNNLLRYLEGAVGLLEQYDLPSSRIMVGIMFGCFLVTDGNYPGAEKIFQQAIRIGRETGNAGIVQHLYLQLFSLYLGQKNAQKAGAALDSMKNIGPPVSEADLFESRYQVEKLKGNREAAFQNLEKAYQLLGANYTKRSADQLAGWETRLHTREKELQVDAQQALLEEQRHTRNILGWLIALISALFLVSVFAWNQQRKAKKVLHHQNQLIERQSEALQQMDQLKSRFFANVSHELRTPLTLLLSPLEQVLKDKALVPHSARLLALAQRNGKQLLDLVNDLLELTKLDIAAPDIREQPTLAYDFLEETVESFLPLAATKHIRLLLDYQPDRRLVVQMDRPKLVKILNNLLANALKFTPRSGTITVRVAQQGTWWTLQVEDTGPGIHPEDLPYIFDLYYQSQRPETKTEGGVGIGLALSRSLAQHLGGQLTVQSTPPQGSIFELLLPFREVSTAQAEPLATRVQQSGDITVLPSSRAEQPEPDAATILVVEDHADLQEFLQTVLSPAYQITMVDNGQAALEFLETAPLLPDLILSDLMMPLLDGFQMLEKLRQRARWQSIPVILLTARADQADRLRAFRTGIDDYILKPFGVEELLVRIDNALRNQESRREWAALTSPPSAAAEDTPLPPGPDLWVAELEAAVRLHLSSHQLTVDHLAGLMQMSRKTLYTRVRESTGLSANQFIQEIRLLQAREMLEAGQVRSLRELAEALGMRETNYLSRLYRGRFGKSPADYL